MASDTVMCLFLFWMGNIEPIAWLIFYTFEILVQPTQRFWDKHPTFKNFCENVSNCFSPIFAFWYLIFWFYRFEVVTGLRYTCRHC